MAKVAMLGAGFIGDFYTFSLHGQRNRDKVVTVYSRDNERGKTFAKKHGIPRWTTSMKEAVNDPEVEVVVIGLPNNLHLEAVKLATAAKKAVLCTKPLGRNASEAIKMLDGISTLETDDDRMTVLNEVNKNFRQIKAYIENLDFTEPEIRMMNKKQLEVFRIYNNAIARINASGNPDWDSFKKETDRMRVLLDEFFLMATTIR